MPGGIWWHCGLGWTWWRRVSSCRLLDALYWCVPGGIGLQMVALCYGEMQLQIGRRLVVVGGRWDWVADGGAVLVVACC